MLLAISATADNTRGPRFAEQVFAAMHQTNRSRLPFVLLYETGSPAIRLAARVPRKLASVFRSQLSAAYPDCKIESVADTTFDNIPKSDLWTMELRLAPDIFPIRRHPEFEDLLERSTADPLSAILSTLAKSQSTVSQARIELHAAPTGRLRRLRSERTLAILSRPFYRSRPLLSSFYAFLATHSCLWPTAIPLGWLARRQADREGPADSSSRSHDRESSYEAAAGKLGRHLYTARLRIVLAPKSGQKTDARRIMHELAGAFGHFTSPRLATFRMHRVSRLRRVASTLSPRRFPSFG